MQDKILNCSKNEKHNTYLILRCALGSFLRSVNVWVMAKGWESKSVEEQQSSAMNADSPKKARMTGEQMEAERNRRRLELSRQQVMQQLQTACNPNHRSMLEKALADLEAQLARLSGTP